MIAFPTITNLEVEQAVLGALLADTNCSLWPQISTLLRPQHFSEAIHARLFDSISSLLAAGKSASPLVLRTYFESDSTLAELGGMAYLAQLIGTAAPAISLKSHVELLRDLSARRSAVASAHELAAKATEVVAGESFRPVLAEHVEAMQCLFDEGSERRITYSAAEAGSAMMDRISRIRAGGVDRNAIRTGIGAIDKFTGGLHRGEYVILGGRPSMGKTALGVQVAANVAQRGGGAFYASLEMPVGLLMPRLASDHLWTAGGTTNVHYQRILRGELNDMEARWIASAAAEMKSWPLIIDDAPGLSPGELEARVQVAKSRLERQGRILDLVIVDHLHKMRQQGAQGKTAEYTEISARLAEMAKRLDCPVLALAQLNRGVESRDDKRPQLADLRESGSIEQDADTVLFVYRPAYYLERKRCSDPSEEAARLADLDAVNTKLELIIEKQRSGPIGTIGLYCDMASNAVRDPADLSDNMEKTA